MEASNPKSSLIRFSKRHEGTLERENGNFLDVEGRDEEGVATL